MISSPLISRIWNEEIRIYCLKLYGVRIIIFVRTLLNKVSVLYSTLIENFALFIFGFSLSKYHPRQMMGVRSRSSIHNPFILGMKIYISSWCYINAWMVSILCLCIELLLYFGNEVGWSSSHPLLCLLHK